MKIKIINKKYLSRMTQQQKQKLSTSLMIFLYKNTKVLSSEDIIKILKNLYNIKYHTKIEFLNGEVYKILSNGTLKKVA